MNAEKWATKVIGPIIVAALAGGGGIVAGSELASRNEGKIELMREDLARMEHKLNRALLLSSIAAGPLTEEQAAILEAME